MKGASKVIMGTTLAMAISLAIVLSLLLILLAELYCSLLLNRRRKTLIPAITTASSAAVAAVSPITLPAPGVLLHPPRRFLFPSLTTPKDSKTNNPVLENQNVTDSPQDQLVYICNPIYNNDAAGPGGTHTPYETPESSPSHLGYSDDEELLEIKLQFSPQLMPMKKLQAEACSVCLRDASSLATSASGSDTGSNIGVSSTASGSPSTSPSW